MPRSRRPCVSLFLVAAATLLVPAAGRADIFWNITFQDVEKNTGFGFDDPALGATRRNTFFAVTDYLNTVLDENGTIDFEVEESLNLGPQPDPADDEGVASAGTYYFDTPNGIQSGWVFGHATTGIDPSLTYASDGTARFDFGYTFNSDLGAPTDSEADLFSFTLHELTHALGVMGQIAADGTSDVSNYPPGSQQPGEPGVYSVFDDFLVRGTTMGDIVNVAGEFVGTTSDLTSGDLFFQGPNAVAANGGNPVKIYAPNPFELGSSLSHLVLDDAVMQYALGRGEMYREYTPQELGILADIGWTLQPAAVPEPSSGILLGLVAVASIAWRKRRSNEDRRLRIENPSTIGTGSGHVTL